MKKAKLVRASFITRVVVDEGASEEEIIKEAVSNLQDKMGNDEVWDNIDSIEDDTEVPYNQEEEEVLYQVPVRRIGYGFKTLSVYASSEEEAQQKALEEAGGHEFSEKSSEYEIDE